MGRKRKGGIWDEVKKLVDAGQQPVITLTAAQQVTVAKEPRTGRPSNPPQEHRFAHYLGNTRPIRSQPRCYNRSCQNHLKRDDLMVCSEYCKDEVIKEARKVLVMLEKDWVVPLPRARGEDG